MKENIIKNKSFAFALRIVKMYNFLKDEKKEYVLSKQLLRSGTAIGALVREAEQAESEDEDVTTAVAVPTTSASGGRGEDGGRAGGGRGGGGRR